MRGNSMYKLIDRFIGIPLVWLAGIFTRHRKCMEHPKYILVIKLSALGDSILLIPALRAIKHRYPNAQITVVCTKINDQLFKICPYVTNVAVLGKGSFWRSLMMLVMRHYDIVFDFDQWVRISPLLAYIANARCRIGFRTAGQYRHYAYTTVVDHKKDRHEVESFCDIVRAAGIDPQGTHLEFWVRHEDEEQSRHVLRAIGVHEYDHYIVMHPAVPAHGVSRQWPVAYYQELAKLIHQHYPKMRIVLTGTAADMSVRKKIADAVGTVVQALPQTSIPTLAAVLKIAQTLVCGNTGIMHLGCAVGIPVVALHGPTNPVKWGPWSKKSMVISSQRNCSPCLSLGFEYGCNNNACMSDISVQQVFDAVNTVLHSIAHKREK